MPSKRDFIISSEYRVGPVEEAEQGRGPSTPAEARAFAERTVLRHVVHGIFDVARLQRALGDFISTGLCSPSAVALVVDRVLELLPREACTLMAIGLATSLRADQFDRVGRGGLLALQDAARLAEPWEADLAVTCLDEALERQGALLFGTRGAVTVIAQAPAARIDAVAAWAERIVRGRHTSAEASGIAVLLAHAKDATPRDLMIAHLKLQAERAFDQSLWISLSQVDEKNILLVDERHFVSPAAHLLASTRTVLRAMAARWGLTDLSAAQGLDQLHRV